MTPVTPVPSEYLVAAFAGEYHLELLGRPLGEKRGGQARVVVEQVVRRPHGVGQPAEHRLAVQDDLCVLGPEPARDAGGGAQLIARPDVAVADREGPHGPSAQLGDQGEEGAGVDPAGQEQSVRDIGPEMLDHDAPDERLEFLHGLLETDASGPQLERGPVPMLAQVESGIHHERRSRGEAADAVHEAGFPRVEAMLKELDEGLGLELGLARPDREQSLQLGGEEEPVGKLRVVERLDAEAIAGEHELSRCQVVEGEGEHPVQRGEGGQAVQGVGVEDDLAVRSRLEASAPRLQSRPELHEIVDFTIGDQGEALVDHGLVSTTDVDDGQPRVGEAQRPGQVDAHVVGTAMGESRCHATKRRLVRGTVPHEYAGYAAHEETPLPLEHSPVPERTARIPASSRPGRW